VVGSRKAEDPFEVLGLTRLSSADDVTDARRRLSKCAHPDVGGSIDRMQRINAAADAALRILAASGVPRPQRRDRSAASPRERLPGAARHDHPSFTIEALPVEAFEGLLVVASWMGEVIDDEPPYCLEVALADPFRSWCRIEIVPDAGASTVSLAVAGEPGWPAPDIERVRDAWIDGLNRLDWSNLDAGPPPP
jgi:hypothetical protein